ncbi:hypothetical protein [Streptomyces lincolnensis]|uniref:hypothetical protein n=1 Tax=Streptomyces lincolnensis TaxID=1915 RepID=UPI00082D7A10|nr:hypothetical protein [Streptomyces lincolnensis]QMV09130.1 hypothetical protein GJU35_28140 [Streptomyces lincolnensis]
MTTPEEELTPGWQQPTPLGYGHGAKEAQFVAAPLLAAAALGLAGVVAAAREKVFLLPGPTLLMLVLSAMSLIYSIQLAYHARKFLYSQQDVLDWYGADIASQPLLWKELRRAQSTDFKVWERYIRGANRYFNRGTVLLAFGVAAALAPGKDSNQPSWRWWAAGVVLLCAVGEISWQLKLRREVNDRSQRKRPGIGQGGSS